MPTLSRAKTLGGIGSILMLLAIIPTIGGLIAIVGVVMTLVAVKYLSDILVEPKIFTNMLIGVLLAVAGIAVSIVLVVGTIFSFMGLGSLAGYTGTGTVPPGLFNLLGTLFIGLAVVWIAFVISAVFVRRSYSIISRRLNVGLFSTAALLYLIGAALTIIFIGLVVIFVAVILLIIAFFSIPDQLPQTTMSPTTTYSPVPPPPPATTP